MRERGLKSNNALFATINPVAPHAGAWIEIIIPSIESHEVIVAPHAGAWIEISLGGPIISCFVVALHAGAWIEI